MELEAQLSEKNVIITLHDRARDYLADKGYDPAMGARPLSRVIQKEIKRPLAEEILFGKLSNKGGAVTIDYKDDELVFVYEDNAPQKSKSEKKGLKKIREREIKPV